MRLLLAHLRLHSHIVKLFGALALAALALVIVQAVRVHTGSVLLLGDVDAARPAQTAQAVPAHAAPQPRPIADARRASERGVTADLAASDELRAPLLAALSCARTTAGQPVLDQDPQLSNDAAGLWRAMVSQPDISPARIIGNRYRFVAVLPLSLAADEPGDPAAGPDEADIARCAFGGADLAALDLTGLSTVGVAVFVDPQPQDGLDDSSAIIIAR